MNQELDKLLEELDQFNGKISEVTISSRINGAAENDQSTRAVAEKNAFRFGEDYLEKKNGWGTYFGPMMVWTGDDGMVYESPSISSITKEIIDYWTLRSNETNNPLMRARYAGLVWDLSLIALNERPSFKVAVDYINALVEVTDKDHCEHPIDSITKITRAYNVASALNDVKLVRRCIESAINLEDRVAEDDKPGLWGFCFRLFILGKSKCLSDIEEKKLVDNLETRLTRVSKEHSPYVCESAALLLAAYYRSKGNTCEVTRVIDVVGNSFEEACDGSHPVLASSWLQHVYDIYTSYNMIENAKRVSRKLSEVGPSVVASMQKISHSVEISTKELDAYLVDITNGGLQQTLTRIAVEFIPNKDELEKRVSDSVKNPPLASLFSTVLQDHAGRPVAKIGGIQEDLEGNIIRELSESIRMDSFFLRHAFNKAVKLYSVSAEALCDHIFLSPLFEKSKKDLIRSGIHAYLNQDYISAINILIPQTEAAVRTLVELMGGETLKKNRQGGLHLRTFDELLRDESVEKCFGTDSSFYFRILLTDPRGWNIRNNVCHGITPANEFNYSLADRVMHVLLCLALARASNDTKHEKTQVGS